MRWRSISSRSRSGAKRTGEACRADALHRDFRGGHRLLAARRPVASRRGIPADPNGVAGRAPLCPAGRGAGPRPGRSAHRRPVPRRVDAGPRRGAEPGAAEPVRQPARLRGVRRAVPHPAVEPGIRRTGNRVVVRAQVPQAPHEQPRTVRHVRDDRRPQEPAPSHLRPGHSSPQRAQRRRPGQRPGPVPPRPNHRSLLHGRGQAGDCGARLGAGGGPGHRSRSGRPFPASSPSPRRSRCGTSFSWAPTPTNTTRRGRTPWRSGCGPGWRRCGGSRTGNESSIASVSDRCRGRTRPIGCWKD